MVQFSAPKAPVLALLLLLAGLLQAALAQDGRSGAPPAVSRPTLEDLPPLNLQQQKPAKLVKGRYSIYRLSAFIPRDVAMKIGSAPFVVVFEFLSLEGRTIDSFYARPHTLLINEEAWYTKPAASRRFVYAAMKFPPNWQNGSEQLQTVIDVECFRCNLDRGQMKYTDISVESFQKERLFYEIDAQSKQNTEVVPALEMPPSNRHEAPYTWKFAFHKRSLCANPYGATVTVQFPLLPKTVTFEWVSQVSSGASSIMPYKARVGITSSIPTALVSFNPYTEEQNLCNQESNAKILLQIQCKEPCSVTRYEVQVFWSDTPKISQQAFSPPIVASYVGSYAKEAGICYIVAVEGHAALLEIEHLGDNASVYVWYDYSRGCKAFGNLQAPDSLRWSQSPQAHDPLQLKKNTNLFGRAFFVDACLCNAFQGRVYRKLNWDLPAGRTEQKDDIKETPYETAKTVDFSAFEQKLIAVQNQYIRQLWSFTANITAPELRCSTENVTATFILTTNCRLAPFQDFPSFKRLQYRTFWDPSAQVAEVVLSTVPAMSQAACKALPLAEALPLQVDCYNCSELTAVVRFTSGPAFQQVYEKPLTLMPSSGAVEGQLSTWRFSAPVHQSILVRGGGTNFTAGLLLPRLKKYPPSTLLAARPRTLVAAEKAWYTKIDNYDMLSVYIAMQLPPNWRHGSEPPQIVIDIECENCDTERVELVYLPERPVESFRRTDVHYRNFFRPNNGKVTTLLPEPRVITHKKRTSWQFVLKKEDLCASPYGAAIELSLSDWLVMETYRWVLQLSSTPGDDNPPLKQYEPEVGVIPSRSTILFKPNKEEYNFCNLKSSKTLSLQVNCKSECEAPLHADLWQLSKPERPQGVSSETVANLTTTFRKDGDLHLCELNVEGNKMRTVRELGKRAVFRFWHNASMTCEEGIGSAISDLELQLATGTAIVGQRINVSQCICEGLQGRVYRLLDWGPVPEYKNHSDANRGNTEVLHTNNGGSGNSEISSLLTLLHTTAIGKRTDSGRRVVFENWDRENLLKSDVPFVTTFCFSPKDILGSWTIESIFLEKTVNVEPFQVSENGFKCYAFNACDAWRVTAQSPPRIVVTGKNLPNQFYWRLDKASYYEDLPANEFYVGRGGWYGTMEQRQRFKDVKSLKEAQVVKTPRLQCVQFPSLRSSKSAEDESQAFASTTEEHWIYLRPAYQLNPNITVPSSGDFRSFGVSAFFGALVIVVLHCLQSCCWE